MLFGSSQLTLGNQYETQSYSREELDLLLVLILGFMLTYEVNSLKEAINGMINHHLLLDFPVIVLRQGYKLLGLSSLHEDY